MSSHSSEAGQNRVMVVASQLGCPTSELPSLLPQLKRRTVAGSVCAGVTRGGLLGPGPEAWQADESSVLDPPGVPGRCVKKMFVLNPGGGGGAHPSL